MKGIENEETPRPGVDRASCYDERMPWLDAGNITHTPTFNLNDVFSTGPSQRYAFQGLPGERFERFLIYTVGLHTG
ncbi:hypothetical protein [Thermococcus sp.]|uniref:hypothetical protein n=1 Tax=Thermococcus sp. TaxID=35749 RepID=UPI002633895F|nr:hypothetical protein [Thermococcus sp.]